MRRKEETRESQSMGDRNSAPHHRGVEGGGGRRQGHRERVSVTQNGVMAKFAAGIQLCPGSTQGAPPDFRDLPKVLPQERQLTKAKGTPHF